MYFYDAVYDIARNKGISVKKVSQSIGRSPAYIGALKSRGSEPIMNTAVEIANVIGYTLCLVPDDNVPDDAYVID